MGLNVRFDSDFEDVGLITPDVFADARGHFSVTFEEREFAEKIGDYKIVQLNTSKSYRGVIRGLHYQISHPQGKLVNVLCGAVEDVIVDIRKSSKTFGKWKKFLLRANSSYLWIPPGYAHGFCALMDGTTFNYACTDFYFPKHERTILYCDPALNISWLAAEHIVNDKDLAGKPLKDAEVYA